MAAFLIILTDAKGLSQLFTLFDLGLGLLMHLVELERLPSSITGGGVLGQ